MATALPRLDFLRPQPTPWRWWPVLPGLALLGLVLAITAVQGRQLEEAQRAREHAARAPTRAPATAVGPQADASTLRLVALLHYDWAAALDVLDGVSVPGLRWLRWEHEATQRVWTLEGEVDRIADLVPLGRDLASLGPVHLQRLSVNEAAVRFDLRAGAAPAAAGPVAK